MGFESSIAGLVIQLVFDSSRAEGRELDPEQPPLVWEASTAPGQWRPVTVVADDTGGFLWGEGVVMLEVPLDARAVDVGGAHHHWVRCRTVEGGTCGCGGITETQVMFLLMRMGGGKIQALVN